MVAPASPLPCRSGPRSGPTSRSPSRASSSCCWSPRCRRWSWPSRACRSLWLIVATVLGGTLAAGGANAINMYVDRDIDALMERTKNRPLVTGAVDARGPRWSSPSASRSLAFVWLWSLVNLLSAVLAVAACLFYVFVYTLWLKRTSSQNIVIGGAAGAVPVLIGWSAVTDTLAWAAVVLFARHLLLDAAPLLGAGHQVQGRLRRGRRADAAVGGQPPHHRPPDARLHGAWSCPDAGVRLDRRAGAPLLGHRRGPGRRASSGCRSTCMRTESPARAMRLFTFSITYVTAALRRDGRRRDHPQRLVKRQNLTFF